MSLAAMCRGRARSPQARLLHWLGHTRAAVLCKALVGRKVAGSAALDDRGHWDFPPHFASGSCVVRLMLLLLLLWLLLLRPCVGCCCCCCCLWLRRRRRCVGHGGDATNGLGSTRLEGTRRRRQRDEQDELCVESRKRECEPNSLSSVRATCARRRSVSARSHLLLAGSQWSGVANRPLFGRASRLSPKPTEGFDRFLKGGSSVVVGYTFHAQRHHQWVRHSSRCETLARVALFVTARHRCQHQHKSTHNAPSTQSALHDVDDAISKRAASDSSHSHAGLDEWDEQTRVRYLATCPLACLRCWI